MIISPSVISVFCAISSFLYAISLLLYVPSQLKVNDEENYINSCSLFAEFVIDQCFFSNWFFTGKGNTYVNSELFSLSSVLLGALFITTKTTTITNNILRIKGRCHFIFNYFLKTRLGKHNNVHYAFLYHQQ
jgi:hypothetical protein